MDAGRLYALLRFEEAALALRTVMRMGLVEDMRDGLFNHDELRTALGMTRQAARTFFALLHVMQILERKGEQFRLTSMAIECLADGRASSRKPYLSMGSGDEVDDLLNLLRGAYPDEALPLYGGDDSGETVMDDIDVAREIALGLASRARNFAVPLASAIAEMAGSAKEIADIGAGSPYVSQACLKAMPQLEKAMLVDRANGMRFVHEITCSERIETTRMVFLERDFFEFVPSADVYVVSNTAHDWQPQEYRQIADNIRNVARKEALVCIHEPLLLTRWESDTEWIQALWMACYALTLLRLTLGKGTCYSLDEHHRILADSGFVPTGSPVPTVDGCTAVFYRLQD